MLRGVLEPKRMRDGFVGHCTLVDIQRIADRFGFGDGSLDTFVREQYSPWKSDIAKRERAGASNGPRHVRNAVVNHIVDHVGWVLVRGRLASLDAASLVDRDIDDDTAGFHELEIVLLNQIRGASPWD